MVRLNNVTDAVFERCLIEKSHGNGIKTGGWRAGRVVRRVLVENCVFQDHCEDGIDTTGGFNDSVVRNTIFRRLGISGMDIKSFYPLNVPIAELAPQNIGIRVENCQFYDTPNAIVLTTEDYALHDGGPEHALLNAANIKAYAPHDIELNDCVVGHAETPLRPTGKGGYCVDSPTKAGECMRIFLLKSAYAIRYRNARFSGDRIIPFEVSGIHHRGHISEEAAEALHALPPELIITGNVLAEPAPPIKPGVTEAPFACGPQ